jgi:hypothetical protein
MATPPEPAVHPDSLVHVQLSPNRRTAGPGSPARFVLFVDNHDRRSRAVKLQFGGAMSRYSRPRLHTLDILSGEQREIPVEVAPQTTAPEGGHEYELTVTATDLHDGTFLDRSSAKIAVDRRPDLKSRPVGPQRTVDSDRFRLRLVAYNAGNVELRVEVFAIDPYHWVRDTGRQRAKDREAAVRSGIDVILAEAATVESVRPGEHWQVEVPSAAPRYPIGFGPRHWLVPVGVRARGWQPQAVFVELDQLPRTILPVRVAVLGAAVLVALIVLAGFVAYLSGR